MWTEPVWARALRRGASLGRVVVFDPPGLGLSDPVDHVPTLEEQADDLRAVMDDAGVERATLFASAFSTGGVVLFATQAPERVDALFLWAPYAQSFRTTPEAELIGYDGRSEEIEAAWADVLDHWGEGRSLAVFAPGPSHERLRRGWAMLERASASPAMVRAITEAETSADLTTILPLVEAPTVVVTHADAVLPPGASRYVAELIPNAEFRLLAPSSEATDSVTGSMRPSTSSSASSPVSDTRRVTRTGSWRRCSSPTSWTRRAMPHGSVTSSGDSCTIATTRWCAAMSTAPAGSSSPPAAMAR